MKSITVLLVDDHPLIREGVTALLKQEADIQVIGEAENGHQAVEAARRLRPDVIVMDISMPQLNGMEAARQILQTAPGTAVLILSAHHDAAFTALVRAIGASGYLNKPDSAEDLPAAIRQVHQGGFVFPPAEEGPVSGMWAGPPGSSQGKLAGHLSQRLT